MINLKKIYFSYPGKMILSNLNWTLETAKIHGLVGANGSGKTTLLNVIAGYNKIEKGEVLWHSQVLKPLSLAFLETENFFYSRIKGKEYVQLFSKKDKKFDMEGWNKIIDLPLNNLTETYSNGMKKKLAFMGLLALNRDLILLDEPFNGLDMDSVEKMKKIILQLKQNGKTIIITSHIFESLLSICDTLSQLDKGVITRVYKKNEFALLEQSIKDRIDSETSEIAALLR